VYPKQNNAWSEWFLPAIGIGYISSSLKKAGFSVQTLNLSLIHDSREAALEEMINKFKIDIIATGGIIHNLDAVREIVETAKKIKPDIVAIVGGGLVTHSPSEVMSIIDKADYGIVGEGEMTACELMSFLEKNEDAKSLNIDEILGVVYRNPKTGQIVVSARRDDIADLDSLPWPDYEGFGYFELAKKYSTDGRINAFIVGSRSCPFRCTFCARSGGAKYRQRSMASIFKEIDYLVNTYHIDEVCFSDELFAEKEDRLFEFCDRIKSYGLGWHASLRVTRRVTLDLLLKMKDAHCVTVQYGLESANDDILKSMRKGTTAAEILSTLRNTKAAGISLTACNFIFGDAAETMDTAMGTLNWVKENYDLLDEIDLVPIVLYPGTQLYDDAVKSGKIKDAVEFIRSGCPIVNVSKIPDAEYYRLMDFELPKTRSLLRMKNACSNRDKLYEAITVSGDRDSYIHSHICERCGCEIVSRIVPQNMTFVRKECPNCKSIFKSYSAIPYFQAFEEQITKILKRPGLAIWGAGALLHELYLSNEYFRNSDVNIIDTSVSKQNSGFYDKSVSSPGEIENMGIHALLYVVSAPVYNLFYSHRSVYNNITDFFWIFNVGLFGI
jgi:radical SAM superfamily enzyme YgiQ (UPF0313 family)